MDHVLACPCCDCHDLFVGQFTAMTFGVRCKGCGLNIVREIPETLTKRTLDEVDAETLRQAIEAWNRRHNDRIGDLLNATPTTD